MSGRFHATAISVSASFGASATARSNAASAPFRSPSSARTLPSLAWVNGSKGSSSAAFFVYSTNSRLAATGSSTKPLATARL